MITYIGIRPFNTFLGSVLFESEKSLDIELDSDLENVLVLNFPDKYKKAEKLKGVVKEPSIVDAIIEATSNLSFDGILTLIQSESYARFGLKIPKTVKTKDGLIACIVKQLS